MTPLRLVQVLVEAEKFLENCDCQNIVNLDICEGEGPMQPRGENCPCYPLRVAVAQAHVESLRG